MKKAYSCGNPARIVLFPCVYDHDSPFLHGLYSLRELRVYKNLSIATAAAAVAVRPDTWKRWENSESHPTIKQARRICDLFRISINSVKW